MREFFEALNRRAAVSADVVAFDDGVTRLSYAALAGRVAGVSEELRSSLPPAGVVGLLGGNRAEWVVGQLAAWHAGMTAVPLPAFFAPAQMAHIVRDAGVSHILCTAEMAGTAALLDAAHHVISGRQAPFVPPPDAIGGSGTGGQIIYTSGSTGQPKGVRLTGRQMLATAAALSKAIGADADDLYLSALPLPLLLETICAVMVPILAGARIRLMPLLAEALGRNASGGIAGLVAVIRPTCMVLVPQLLAAWVAELLAAGQRAPDCLRFVAVGGAAVPPTLARQAWELGIPIHEGYGLSECGSVVSLNRAGERKPGTVGKPLPGVDVRIANGEIIVGGPSVMERYLHGSPVSGIWRTGDMGTLDEDGFLTVHGRRDNLLVTAFGRNISPEWIESLVLGDPRIGHCLLTLAEGVHPHILLAPSKQGESWFRTASASQIQALIADCCRDVPVYAFPRSHRVVSAEDWLKRGLITGNGRLRRKAILEAYGMPDGISLERQAGERKAAS